MAIRTSPFAPLAPLAVVVALAPACSGSGGTAGTGATAASTPSTTAAGTRPPGAPATTPGTTAGSTPGSTPVTEVAVDMTEWEVRPATTVLPAGTIRFNAINKGKETHELVLFKTDLAPDALPLDQDGAVDERGTGVELVDEVEDVAAGERKSFTATVTPGAYLLVCNLVDKDTTHFGHKMYVAITVR